MQEASSTSTWSSWAIKVVYRRRKKDENDDDDIVQRNIPLSI